MSLPAYWRASTSCRLRNSCRCLTQSARQYLLTPSNTARTVTTASIVRSDQRNPRRFGACPSIVTPPMTPHLVIDTSSRFFDRRAIRSDLARFSPRRRVDGVRQLEPYIRRHSSEREPHTPDELAPLQCQTD